MMGEEYKEGETGTKTTQRCMMKMHLGNKMQQDAALRDGVLSYKWKHEFHLKIIRPKGIAN